MHQCIKFILFWNDTLHVSDGLSVHRQEFKTVHTATGISQTDNAVCLLSNGRPYERQIRSNIRHSELNFPEFSMHTDKNITFVLSQFPFFPPSFLPL